jgi:hypothetical protein
MHFFVLSMIGRHFDNDIIFILFHNINLIKSSIKNLIINVKSIKTTVWRCFKIKICKLRFCLINYFQIY